MKAVVHLRARSPVHVGGGEPLGNLDFICLGPKLYPVRLGALERVLSERGLVTAFAREITAAGAPFVLEDFLRRHGLPPSEVAQQIARYAVSWRASRRPTVVRGFSRDPFGAPRLPGTTLKGALRTAWLGHAVDQQPDQMLQSIAAKVRDAAAASSSRRRFLGRSVAAGAEENAFRVLRIPPHPSRRYTKLHQDIWRSLQVRDSRPIDAAAVEVREVALWSRRADGSPYRKPTGTLCAECLRAGTEVTVEVSIDTRGLGPLPWDSVGELFAGAGRWAAQIWAWEREYLHSLSGSSEMQTLVDFYDSAPAGLRLGWGSGWHGLSIGTALPSDLRSAVATTFYERSQGGFPKTRRLVATDGEPLVPLGWFDVEVEPA